MMRFSILAVMIVICASLILSTAAMASPDLDIRHVSVGGIVDPYPPNTGPPIDPGAIWGQWFKRGTVEENRCHEFYDNKEGYGGSLQQSTNAIFGRAKNLVYNQGNIVAFNIDATITNDTPWPDGPWKWGTNSHGEYHEGEPPPLGLCDHTPYIGTLYDTKLTGDFAISDLLNVPAAWTGPYRNKQPYIIAGNEDQLAWYCWTEVGGYYVPTWDFGNILIGQSVTKTLSFTVGGGGLAAGDARFYSVFESDAFGYDLFANRTTSLKISNWLDNLVRDDGTAYPVNPLLSSDVGVFHMVPEPGSLVTLGAGLITMAGLWRKRRS